MRLKTCNIAYIMLLHLFVIGCVPRFIQEHRAQEFYREGQQLQMEGESQRAFKKFKQSLELAEEIGFRAGVGHNLNEMAIIHTSQGRYEEARGELQKAIAIYRELKMEPEVSKAMNNVALTWLGEGDAHAALEQYEALLEWDRQTGNRLGMGITLNNMGQVLERRLGKPETARLKYQQAAQIFEMIGNKEYLQQVQERLQ